MGETASSADRLLLVFADEARGREVAEVLARAIDSSSLSAFSGRAGAPALECQSSLPEFVAAFERGAASTLVVDPAHAFRITGALTILSSLLRDSRDPALRVVLYADSTEWALRGTCALASTGRCTLVVRGVDDTQLVTEVLRNRVPNAEMRQWITEVAPQIRALPDPARARWHRAIIAPENESVKRIAADIGVSRRTMERWFVDCGLPSPARLLRSIQMTAAREQQSSVAIMARVLDEPARPRASEVTSRSRGD